MENKTTDEKTIVLKWKVVIPIIGFLLVVSNLFTRWISVIEQNTDKIFYNEESGKRRIKNSQKETLYLIEIKDLKHELKECEKK